MPAAENNESGNSGMVSEVVPEAGVLAVRIQRLSLMDHQRVECGAMDGNLQGAANISRDLPQLTSNTWFRLLMQSTLCMWGLL